MVLYYWRLPKHGAFYFPTIYDNNMAGARILQVRIPPAPLITESQNEVWQYTVEKCATSVEVIFLLNEK
jgi:hypothetical protein